MNITLWILQVLVGAMFVMSGYGKAFFPWEEITATVPWSDGVSQDLMRFIGWAEVLGGIGLVLPASIKVKPILTPIAATGLTLIMILATGFHVMRAEYSFLPWSLVLGCLAGFVAYGRFVLKPFPGDLTSQKSEGKVGGE
ncbi:MAG TPA: DoxX family protein [Bacteroidota bacterium]